MALVLANIGNRDVLCDGQECRPARDRGGEILNAYIGERERLSFPIFGRALEHLQKDLGERRQDLEVVLFVTDQADPAHRSTTRGVWKDNKKAFRGFVKISWRSSTVPCYESCSRCTGNGCRHTEKTRAPKRCTYSRRRGAACNMAFCFIQSRCTGRS